MELAVCPFDLVLEMGISLRFVALPSFEGIYRTGEPGVILLNTLRPSGRQRYNCGHELGHHLFGHGDRIDALLDKASRATRQFQPEEYVADRFAASLLMPKLAVGRAFFCRGWQVSNPTPEQAYVVSTYLGVGYTTLIRYLNGTLGLIDTEAAKTLSRHKPKVLRAQLAEAEIDGNVIVADEHWLGRPIDMVIGDLLLLPAAAEHSGAAITPVSPAHPGRFSASQRGTATVSLVHHGWSQTVRVSPRQYRGLGRYRYLEDLEDDDDQALH